MKVAAAKRDAKQSEHIKPFSFIQRTLHDRDFYIPLIISSLLFGVFCRMNYAPDTYFDIMRNGRTVLDEAFLFNGRFITAIFVFLFKKLSFSAEFVYILSFTTALIAISLSIYLLKKYLIDRWIKNSNLSLFISIITVANPFSLELFFFYEKGAMLLSVFLCILGAIYFQKYLDNKRIKYAIASALLAIAASFCYQGTLGFYIVLLTIINIFSNKKISLFIKNTLLSVFLYIVAPICNIAMTKLFIQGGRVGNNIKIIEAAQIVLSKVNSLIEAFNIVPIWIIYIVAILVSILTSITLLKRGEQSMRDSLLTVAELFYLFVVILLAAVAPYFAQSTNTIWVVPRSSFAFGAMIGILSCVFYANIKKTSWKYCYKLPLIYCILLLVLQMYNFTSFGINNYVVSNLDAQRAKRVKIIIEKYEEETGKEIKKIAPYHDANPKMAYDNILTFSDVNVSAFSVRWATTDLINYWTSSNYKRARRTSYENECRAIDNDMSDGDEVIFHNHIAVICTY